MLEGASLGQPAHQWRHYVDVAKTIIWPHCIMSRSHTISTSTPSVSPSQNTEKIGLDQAIKRAMTPKICRSQQEELTIKIQSLADELDIELPDDLSQIDLEVKQIYHLSNSGEPHPFWRMVELSTEDAGDCVSIARTRGSP